MNKEFSHQKGKNQVVSFVNYFKNLTNQNKTLRVILLSEQYESPFITFSPFNKRENTPDFDAIFRIEGSSGYTFCFIQSKYTSSPWTKKKLKSNFEDFVVDSYSTSQFFFGQRKEALFLFVANEICADCLHTLDVVDPSYIEDVCKRKSKNTYKVDKKVVSFLSSRIKYFLFPYWLQQLLRTS